jgi:hypothetical protein
MLAVETNISSYTIPAREHSLADSTQISRPACPSGHEPTVFLLTQNLAFLNPVPVSFVKM